MNGSRPARINTGQQPPAPAAAPRLPPRSPGGGYIFQGGSAKQPSSPRQRAASTHGSEGVGPAGGARASLSSSASSRAGGPPSSPPSAAAVAASASAFSVRGGRGLHGNYGGGGGSSSYRSSLSGGSVGLGHRLGGSSQQPSRTMVTAHPGGGSGVGDYGDHALRENSPTAELSYANTAALAPAQLPTLMLMDRVDALKTAGGKDPESPYRVVPWRMRERMKTVQVALVMCLNIGTDPPDVVKTPPYACEECWIDPLSLPPQKAIEKIGKALQGQYERFQPKARYKTCLDPTCDDVKKLCVSLRRNAREERVLFHYNGHGVPRPTQNGEIWVFNKDFTQYIPLSVYELQRWIGTPAIYVFDCSWAALLLPLFQSYMDHQENTLREQHKRAREERESAWAGAEKKTAQQQDVNAQAGAANSAGQSDETARARATVTAQSSHSPRKQQQETQRQHSQRGKGGSSQPSSKEGEATITRKAAEDAVLAKERKELAKVRDCIVLCATGAAGTLPTNPDFPADIFTACLTTPIKIALRWFMKRNPLSTHRVTASMLNRIPGRLQDRKTPLGELNWVFTAITDTIAWNVLPRAQFQRLFRQDLLVASLFRNFLLADRIMRSVNCAPVSWPRLPPTAQHPLWDAWDLVAETCLSQLPGMVNAQEAAEREKKASTVTKDSAGRGGGGRGGLGGSASSSSTMNMGAVSPVRLLKSAIAPSIPPPFSTPQIQLAMQITQIQQHFYQMQQNAQHEQRAMQTLQQQLAFIQGQQQQLMLQSHQHQHQNQNQHQHQHQQMLQHHQQQHQQVQMHVQQQTIKLQQQFKQMEQVQQQMRQVKMQHMQILQRENPHFQRQQLHTLWQQQIKQFHEWKQKSMQVAEEEKKRRQQQQQQQHVREMAPPRLHSEPRRFVPPAPSPRDPGASSKWSTRQSADSAAPKKFRHCSFFTEQLTAFEVWLEYASQDKRPPEQLPIVLQVLLSQVHRHRALLLLARFLDLGPWAVNQALSVGIFPYVLKLLQSPAVELRNVLVFIWTKILSLEAACQVELIKDGGQNYFIRHLCSGYMPDMNNPNGMSVMHQIQNYMQRAREDRMGNIRVLPSAERILACGALSAIMHNNRDGQRHCLHKSLHQICAAQTTDPDPLLRRWICLCLGKLWRDHMDARFVALRDGVQDCVMVLLGDEAPEVRAAAIYALGTLIGVHGPNLTSGNSQMTGSKKSMTSPSPLQTAASTMGMSPQSPYSKSPLFRSWLKSDSRLHEDAQIDVAIATQIRRLRLDGSVLVRHELLLALARLFFHPAHSLPLQAVAYTIDRMERRLRESKKNRQAAKNSAKSKAGKGNNAKIRGATPMPVPEKNSNTRSGMDGGGEAADFSLAGSSGPLQSPSIASVDAIASPRNIGGKSATGTSASTGSSNSAAGSPRSPAKHHHGSSPRLSSIASGTIASIEAALGGDKQGAIGYMQIWKTVRQMQLRDPFPEIKRIAGILIHEVLSKLSRNSTLKARLSGKSHSGERKALRVLPSSSEVSTDAHSVVKGAGNRTKIANMLGLSSISSSTTSEKPPMMARSISNNVAGALAPPALLQRSQSSLESYSQQLQGQDARTNNIYGNRDNQAGLSTATWDVFDLPLPVFEHDALGSTMRALDLDPDRLYVLSVKRFGKPMTIDRGDNKLYIRLDDDGTAIAGRDPLTANQARRAWHQQRNDRIAEQAKTMFPKGMFFESNQSGPVDLDDGDLQAHDASSSLGGEVNRRLKVASTLSRVSNNKDGGGEGDSKSQAFNRFEQSAILDCESEATSLLLFHPFEAVLVMADLRDGLSVWNYGSGKKLSRFSNCNRPGTRITSLQWVNEQEPTRLMTGSDDGVVRVWCGTKLMSEIQAINEVEERQESVFQALEQAGFISGIDRSKSDQQNNPTAGRNQAGNKGSTRGGALVRSPAQMLTAWKAAPDVNPGARGSGLILKWQQLSGRLFAAGNSSVIRVWDMFREQCISTIPSGADTCVTAMGSDWNSDVGGGDGVVMCGYGDGSLRMFDARLPPDVSNVLTYIEHSTWVVNVEMQRGGGKHIISGAVSGEIKFWDVRRSGGGGYRHRPSSTKTIELHRSPMTALAVHEFAPVVASGSHNQFIKVMDTGGNLISMIRYHDGFLGQRIGPVSCLAFHPHRPVLAAGATDSIVAIYSSRGKMSSD